MAKCEEKQWGFLEAGQILNYHAGCSIFQRVFSRFIKFICVLWVKWNTKKFLGKFCDEGVFAIVIITFLSR